jgi:hypothetical protein
MINQTKNVSITRIIGGLEFSFTCVRVAAHGFGGITYSHSWHWGVSSLDARTMAGGSAKSLRRIISKQLESADPIAVESSSFDQYSRIYEDQKGELPSMFHLRIYEVDYADIESPSNCLKKSLEEMESEKEGAYRLVLKLWNGVTIKEWRKDW